MDIRKCYAYNPAGLRCMQPANHDGDHAHAITWTDDECWAPSDGPAVPPTVVRIGREEITEHIAPEPSECVICDHPMHRGPCRADFGDFGCDCAEGIA
jgi:hypothetical protein